MTGQAAFSDGVAAALARGNDRIVITGAGGWLGLATLELLANALGDNWQERVVCFGSSARTLTLRDGRLIEQSALAEIAYLPHQPTLLLHLAFLTKDKVDGMSETEYRAANRMLRQSVLDAMDAIGVDAVFVASSGAARSAADPDAAYAMQLYGALKKQDEDEFAAWADARSKTAVITRIFNIAGPYINKHGAYAIASFILNALNGDTIQVKAPHRVIRGNVAIRELMSLVLARLLARSGRVERFDSGGDALELEALATEVAHAIGPVPVERAAISSQHIDHYVGDKQVYDKLLQANGIAMVSLEDMICETAEYLRETVPLNRN